MWPDLIVFLFGYIEVTTNMMQEMDAISTTSICMVVLSLLRMPIFTLFS